MTFSLCCRKHMKNGASLQSCGIQRPTFVNMSTINRTTRQSSPMDYTQRTRKTKHAMLKVNPALPLRLINSCRSLVMMETRKKYVRSSSRKQVNVKHANASFKCISSTGHSLRLSQPNTFLPCDSTIKLRTKSSDQHLL